jgi:hypothetical protein
VEHNHPPPPGRAHSAATDYSDSNHATHLGACVRVLRKGGSGQRHAVLRQRHEEHRDVEVIAAEVRLPAAVRQLPDLRRRTQHTTLARSDKAPRDTSHRVAVGEEETETAGET